MPSDLLRTYDHLVTGGTLIPYRRNMAWTLLLYYSPALTRSVAGDSMSADNSDGQPHLAASVCRRIKTLQRWQRWHQYHLKGSSISKIIGRCAAVSVRGCDASLIAAPFALLDIRPDRAEK